MKSTLPLLLVILLLTSCRLTADKKYTVSGLLPDRSYDGQTAYILDTFNDSIRLDSTVVKRGGFTFAGKLQDDKLARVQLGNREVFFVFENRGIKVDMISGSVIGTDLNRKLTDFKAKYIPIEGILREIKMGVYNLTDLEQTQIESIQEGWANQQWRVRTKQFVEDLYYQNSDNKLGILALKALDKEYGKDRKYLSILALAAKDKMDQNDLVVKLTSYYHKANPTNGAQYRNFKTTLESGEEVEFAQYISKGKYVLVNMWASWCAPCRKEMETLKDLYKRYKSNQFEMVGVSVWDKEKDARKAIEQDNLKWPQILNTQDVATKLYEVKTVPHLMLIGPDGTVLINDIDPENLLQTMAHFLH